MQQVRNLVTAVVPGVEPDEVKVVGANVKPAAGAEAKDSKPVPADRATDEQYAWFELAAEAPAPLVTAAHEGRKYVLLSLRPEEAMLADNDGPRRWRIADASVGKTAGERPTVQVALDDAARGAWRH